MRFKILIIQKILFRYLIQLLLNLRKIFIQIKRSHGNDISAHLIFAIWINHLISLSI